MQLLVLFNRHRRELWVSALRYHSMRKHLNYCFHWFQCWIHSSFYFLSKRLSHCLFSLSRFQTSSFVFVFCFFVLSCWILVSLWFVDFWCYWLCHVIVKWHWWWCGPSIFGLCKQKSVNEWFFLNITEYSENSSALISFQIRFDDWAHQQIGVICAYMFRIGSAEKYRFSTVVPYIIIVSETGTS